MKFEVMLVDDDDMVLFVISRYIRKSGLSPNPLNFRNGQEALDYITAHQDPEMNFIVLLDINMPVMNGWQFLEAVKDHEVAQRIRVAMVTSSVDFEDSDRAKTFPMVVSYLIKPVDTDMLASLKKVPQLQEFYS